MIKITNTYNDPNIAALFLSNSVKFCCITEAVGCTAG